MEIALCIQPSDQIFQEIEIAVKAQWPNGLLFRLESTKSVSDFLRNIINNNFEEKEEEKYFPGGIPDQLQVKLFILDVESLGAMEAVTLEKMQQLLLEKGLSNEEKPVGFVLTDTNPDPGILKKYVSPCVRNLLVTPFEQMTLKGFLGAALAGNAPVADDLYIHKCNTEIEVLKEVDVTRITELGFRTVSPVEIPLQNRAKYYSMRFGQDAGRAVYAQCVKNHPQPDGKVESSFSYFGIAQSHLTTVRKDLLSSNNIETLPFSGETDPEYTADFVVLSANKKLFEDAEYNINERFIGINPVHCESEKDFNELEKELNVTGVLIHDSAIEEGSQLKNLVHKFLTDDKLKVFICGDSHVGDFVALEKFNEYDDHFYFPLDRFYFVRKLKLHFPEWHMDPDNPLDRKSLIVDEKMEVALPQEINSVSELSVAFDYNREIQISSMRKFKFNMPDMSEDIVIHGICNYCGKKPDGNYNCEFIFYAIDEEALIFIRRWIIAVGANPDKE